MISPNATPMAAPLRSARLTFFLPCGFTQALQLYVLSKGSFTMGALTMLAFSLGTLPALLSLSALSSFATGAFQRHFLKFAGAAVVILGLFNIQSGLTLAATAGGPSVATVASNDAPSAQAVPMVPIVDGKQIVDMKIVGYQYQPHLFNVVQGIPVEWRIDATEAEGCGRVLLAPAAGVRRMLPSGPTLISFTPQQPGEIRFNCAMGMMTRGSRSPYFRARRRPRRLRRFRRPPRRPRCKQPPCRASRPAASRRSSR